MAIKYHGGSEFTFDYFVPHRIQFIAINMHFQLKTFQLMRLCHRSPSSSGARNLFSILAENKSSSEIKANQPDQLSEQPKM